MNPTPPAARLLFPTVLFLTGASCGGAETALPGCEPDGRLGIVAQSVPGAAYVPCVATLPVGWRLTRFDTVAGSTEITLRSDRSAWPVEVALNPTCDVGRATPATPRDEGVRSYTQVDGVSPRYAGHTYDVFAGGCVTSTFDFERGPHIALIDDLARAVRLYPRRQLRSELRDRLGVTLDP